MKDQENLTPLYTVKGVKGAHILLGMREVDTTPEPGAEPIRQTIADVHLIGALLPYSVNVDDIALFTMEDRLAETSDIYISLAQEAITAYGLDGKRTQRAAALARDKYAVQVAKRDEHGEPIPNPSHKKLCVKGSNNGWYVVTVGSCTCPDHKNGHVCKHRIAAWMMKQITARPLAAAARVTVAEYVKKYMEA